MSNKRRGAAAASLDSTSHGLKRRKVSVSAPISLGLQIIIHPKPFLSLLPDL
jgi:hypothetical protein